MNKFSWYEAQSVEDALSQVTATVSEEINDKVGGRAVLKAGGVDLLDFIKEGLARPGKIVNILKIPGLDQVSFDEKSGLRIGANVTLATMEHHPVIREKYAALYQSVIHAATLQLRYMSTLGGNLAQRTRCWYFRSEDHPCLRKGGDTCFARNGENENHAILDNGSCVSVHSSSIATALMAFEATVEIVKADGSKKTVALEDFFVSPGEDSSRESILESDEMITAVTLLPPKSNVRSNYRKQGSRESYDWAIADVAVVVEMSGKTCQKAVVVLGAAAPTPIRSRAAEVAITGKVLSEATVKTAAEAALLRARPLSQNAYKVPVFKSIIQRTILEIV